MIYIVGLGTIKEAEAFVPVKECLEQDCDIDVYLGTFFSTNKIKNKVIYNMEYLRDNNPLIKTGYLNTLKDNFVIDFARSNIEYLKSKGINAYYMPFGFSNTMKKVKHKNKTIDVLFIGSIHFKRRQDIINELSKHCNVVVPDKVYGKDLDDLIGKSKVHLNMHHAEGQPLEVVRVNYLLANNCTVVSERGNDIELDSKYSNNVIFSSYKNLVDACLSSLNKQVNSSNLLTNLRHNSKDACKWAKEKICQR
jgi:hypothetical protein